MAFASVNGATVLEGSIGLPRIGVWTADVELPAPPSVTQLSGPATLQLGTALTLTGTFGRTGIDGRGRIRARVIGGGAGMGKTLPPRSYVGATLRLPLVDLLTSAGEALSPTSDAGVLAYQMPAWSRMQGIAGASLAALLAVPAASWRVLPDGTVWVGNETWKPSNMSAVAISYEPESRRRTVASLVPTILPGQTYDGAQVGFVQHVLTPRALRTVLLLE